MPLLPEDPSGLALPLQPTQGLVHVDHPLSHPCLGEDQEIVGLSEDPLLPRLVQEEELGVVQSLVYGLGVETPLGEAPFVETGETEGSATSTIARISASTPRRSLTKG